MLEVSATQEGVTMPLKGTLNAGSSVEVTFSADFSNAGTSSMLTGYVPDPATPPPPGPQFATLAPGTTESHAQNPLAPAFQYKITIDVPDAQGSGHLEVRDLRAE